MKVLISGYYGFGNLGDEALLSGIVNVLKTAGHGVTVLSNAPAATEAMHNVKAVHRIKGLAAALLRTDALLSGGGGLLQDKTSFRSLQYYLSLLRLAKVLSKKVIVYGQSVGPLSERGKRAVAKTLQGVAISVRDKTSQALLESLHLEAHLGADSALLLETPEAVTRTETAVLIPRAGYPEITEALIKLARALQNQGVSVLATAVQAEEDTEALEQIKAAVPHLSTSYPTSPQDLLTRLASADYVVSGRLHGLILAAVAGTPFCGLIYDPKVAAFLDEAGAPAFTLPIDVPRLIRCTLEKPEISPNKLETLKARAYDGATWLKRQLES